MFSKCGRFTPEEIEHCKAARRKVYEHDGKIYYANNVIMLSERELEPYDIYEQTQKYFEITDSAISLEDLATNTVNIFLDPKPKASY